MSFGVKFLDDIIGGLFNGELTTIAARSGVGKTALALQIMLNCMEQGKNNNLLGWFVGGSRANKLDEFTEDIAKFIDTESLGCTFEGNSIVK